MKDHKFRSKIHRKINNHQEKIIIKLVLPNLSGIFMLIQITRPRLVVDHMRMIIYQLLSRKNKLKSYNNLKKLILNHPLKVRLTLEVIRMLHPLI